MAILVSTALVQVTTGFLNVLNWYPFPWYFTAVHRFLGYVLVGSVLLHIGVKLPDIAYGLKARFAEADVLTEIPWDENPDSHSNAGTLPDPPTPGISAAGHAGRGRGRLGVVVVTRSGQTVTPLEPVGLLAARQWTKGPQGVPVNRTAEQAKVLGLATAAGLGARGRRTAAVRADPGRPRAARDARGSAARSAASRAGASGPRWRGLSLLEIVQQAGGTADSRVQVLSLEPEGFNRSFVEGPQLSRGAAGHPPQRASGSTSTTATRCG